MTVVQSFGCCVFIAALMAGCGSGEKRRKTRADLMPDTLIDAAGRMVAIPAPVRRVVSPFTMYTRLIASIGGCDKLVGISHTCVLPEEERGCDGTLLDLPDVGPFGANVELIASLKPDLIFASKTDIAAFTEKTGAAVIAVDFTADVPMREMFDRQIDIIGKALRLRPQADSLKQFIAAVLDPVTLITSTLPDSARPRVYFAWTSWTGDILNTVCEFDPIELAGGVNVARGAKNFAKGERGILVSREHIMQWDPEVIFISRYQPQKWQKGGPTQPLSVTIRDVLNDPLMQSVRAVKKKRIYYTTAFCNWWPQQRAIVQVLYMAKLLHPELFASIDVEREGNAVFRRFYGADSLYTAMAAELELHSWK
ncbi:MAG: ABC transporter substrate-binding protein [Chitinispirillaceae bacterium]|nr:ABC transporter substrate-binding protein [Chitinispirillaceae bacterium]